MGSSGGLTCVRHNSPKSSATHCYQCVQCFPVSRQWYGCQCLGFLTCRQMLVHAIAHGDCTDTVDESALEADFGRKMPNCGTGDSNPRQYCAQLFSLTFLRLSFNRPWVPSVRWLSSLVVRVVVKSQELTLYAYHICTSTFFFFFFFLVPKMGH